MPLALAILDEEGTVDVTKLDGYQAMILEKEHAAQRETLLREHIAQLDLLFKLQLEKLEKEHTAQRETLLRLHAGQLEDFKSGQAAIPEDEASKAEKSYESAARKYGRKHVKTRVRLDAWNKLRFAGLE